MSSQPLLWIILLQSGSESDAQEPLELGFGQSLGFILALFHICCIKLGRHKETFLSLSLILDMEFHVKRIWTMKTLGPKPGAQWISHLIDLRVAKCKLCPSVTFISCILQSLYLEVLISDSA